MKAELNPKATGLRIAIVALQDIVPKDVWPKIGMVLADALHELNRLQAENDKLSSQKRWLESDRDYWQHKWGNGNG